MINNQPISPEQTAAIAKMLTLCHVRSYPAKTTIIRPGDKGDTLHYIVEGSASVCAEDDEGHELILAYLNKNDFIGEIGVFKPPGDRQVTVRTRVACKLAEISYVRLHQAMHNELADQSAYLLSLFGEQLACRLLITSRKYCDLAFSWTLKGVLPAHCWI